MFQYRIAYYMAMFSIKILELIDIYKCYCFNRRDWHIKDITPLINSMIKNKAIRDSSKWIYPHFMDSVSGIICCCNKKCWGGNDCYLIVSECSRRIRIIDSYNEPISSNRDGHINADSLNWILRDSICVYRILKIRILRYLYYLPNIFFLLCALG